MHDLIKRSLKSQVEVRENVIRQLMPKCLTDEGAVIYLKERGFMFCVGPTTPTRPFSITEVRYMGKCVGVIEDVFQGSTYTCKFTPIN